VADPIEILARSPHEAGLFFDFDGTLSEIVARPEHARPLPGIPETLGDLGEIFKVVAVVSGRSALQLVEWLGPRLEIWGLHGAQRAHDGKVELTPEFRAYEETMKEVLDEARRRLDALGIEGLLVEDKQVMVGLHWRMAREQAAAERAVSSVAAELADLNSLRLGHGKMAIELRPAVDVSKKDVVLRRTEAEGLKSVAFAGDDVVDLPAFDALDEHAARGIATVRIAVASEEMPHEVEERADVVVDGPEGMLAWLQELRSASGGVAGSSPS
jgi:trehalose 6-phosphate phosphatase